MIILNTVCALDIELEGQRRRKVQAALSHGESLGKFDHDECLLAIRLLSNHRTRTGPRFDLGIRAALVTVAKSSLDGRCTSLIITSRVEAYEEVHRHGNFPQPTMEMRSVYRLVDLARHPFPL